MDFNIVYEILVSTLSSVAPIKMFAVSGAVTALLALTFHLHSEYLAFIALGHGGTPSTVMGFMKVKFLSLLALSNPYQPRPIEARSARSYLSRLPKRKGGRPVTRGIAPHRQVTQMADKGILMELSSAITAMGTDSESEITGISCLEKNGLGLFSKVLTKQNEICHIHSSDGSMHMVLGAADSKVVLEAEWGERHPLSHGGWFERFVPAGSVMVYAPRDEAELESVIRIVRAAAWHVGGEGEHTEMSGQRSDSKDSGYSSATGS